MTPSEIEAKVIEAVRDGCAAVKGPMRTQALHATLDYMGVPATKWRDFRRADAITALTSRGVLKWDGHFYVSIVEEVK